MLLALLGRTDLDRRARLDIVARVGEHLPVWAAHALRVYVGLSGASNADILDGNSPTMDIEFVPSH